MAKVTSHANHNIILYILHMNIVRQTTPCMLSLNMCTYSMHLARHTWASSWHAVQHALSCYKHPAASCSAICIKLAQCLYIRHQCGSMLCVKDGLVKCSDPHISHTKPFTQVYWCPKVASWKAMPLSGVFESEKKFWDSLWTSHVWGITGAGGWWVAHGGEAVFGMLVFAIFLWAEIRPFAWKACF